MYTRAADQEIQKKRFDLLKPIVEKAQKAVSDVAKEKGLKYVLDSSPGKGLIVFEGEDLMPSVKSKLGIQSGRGEVQLNTILCCSFSFRNNM